MKYDKKESKQKVKIRDKTGQLVTRNIIASFWLAKQANSAIIDAFCMYFTVNTNFYIKKS